MPEAEECSRNSRLVQSSRAVSLTNHRKNDEEIEEEKEKEKEKKKRSSARFKIATL